MSIERLSRYVWFEVDNLDAAVLAAGWFGMGVRRDRDGYNLETEGIQTVRAAAATG